MNNKVCFILEGKELYIDEVFVDFNELPIYFSCISDDKYYLALCCEYDNQNYVLVESSSKEIVEMLTAKITIRSTFTKKVKHWVVVAGEDITKEQLQENDFETVFVDAFDNFKRFKIDTFKHPICM